MRLNRTDKKNSSRGWTKAGGSEDKPKKPKLISPNVYIGRVSSDMLATVFAPKMEELALRSLEEFADHMMVHEDKVRELMTTAKSAQKERNEAEEEEEDEREEAELEIEADGTVKNTEPKIDILLPDPPAKPIFHSQFMIDECLTMVSDISDHFSENGGWKVHANAAKFERGLDEKYGIFRPFITNHPEVEHFIRSVQRKYAMGYFSPLRQGSPPIPKSTSVIILFMMQRNNVRWDAMILMALFLLIGLQPWALVACVAIFQQLVNRRTRKPIGTMTATVEPVEPYWRVNNNQHEEAHNGDEAKTKKDILLQRVGIPLGEKEQIDGSQYNAILIGSGPGTLYAGALLARANRKVMILSPGADASGCVVLDDVPAKFKDVPFDVESANISRIERQQELLTPALCTSSDYQGGIRFAQIGSEADGYAFEILSIPGMGSDGFEAQLPFVLRSAGGTRSLMDDAAASLSDGWPASDGSPGGSTSGMYLAACATINATAGAFYLSKILPEKSKSLQKASNYEESACRYASSFLNKCFPLNPHLRSLMAGIGMKCENIKPSNTSMGAHVTNVCAATGGEGMHYPVGGPRSLCHALASVIDQCGGRIVTNAHVKELLFDDAKAKPDTTAGEPEPPRCVGVKLVNATEIKLQQVADSEGGGQDSVVVNTKGFIDTFVRLLPEQIRTAHKVPMGLPALSERRPVFKMLFALQGSAGDLSVTGADFYRLPAAALARDHADPTTGAITLGEIGWSDEITPERQANTAGVQVDNVNTDDNADDADQSGTRGKRTKAAEHTKLPSRVKFDAGVSWMQISFPSAKDPSWEERHGKVSTCVVTVEADDDFVVHYDTKPKLFSIVPNKVNDTGNRGRLMEKVKRDLLELYPQLQGRFAWMDWGRLNSCRA